MRKVLFGVIITLIILFAFKYCDNKKESKRLVKENSVLIQHELKKVGKLVITEGHFSEVFTYKNSKEILGDYITSSKRALVVVNADVSIAFDLNKLVYHIDETKKTLTITHIPEEEITINPDLEYYDVQADFLNPFDAEDYNKIKETIKKSLLEKVEQSNFKTNAKNRLVSELYKFYMLTDLFGWTLKYNNTTITKSKDFIDLYN